MSSRPLPGNALFWLAVWAAAFGFAEGAVVVYLRALYYPGGFEFPLVAFDEHLLDVEIAREAATMLMLLGAACASARDRMRRFGAFAFTFGIWDLAYYAMLKLTLDWPAGGVLDVLLAWDILFLIPSVWVGPVLAPCLVSVALIGAGALIFCEPEGRDWSFLRPTDWALMVIAGLVIITSFLLTPEPAPGTTAIEGYRWWMLGLGLGGGIGCFALRWRKR